MSITNTNADGTKSTIDMVKVMSWGDVYIFTTIHAPFHKINGTVTKSIKVHQSKSKKMGVTMSIGDDIKGGFTSASTKTFDEEDNLEGMFDISMDGKSMTILSKIIRKGEKPETALTQDEISIIKKILSSSDDARKAITDVAEAIVGANNRKRLQ